VERIALRQGESFEFWQTKLDEKIREISLGFWPILTTTFIWIVDIRELGIGENISRTLSKSIKYGL